MESRGGLLVAARWSEGWFRGHQRRSRVSPESDCLVSRPSPADSERVPVAVRHRAVEIK